MLEMFVNGFAVEGSAADEFSLRRGPIRTPGVFCSKCPEDAFVAAPLLRADPELWLIYMLRDPRDVVVSRHRLRPDLYWTNLRSWRELHASAARVLTHPRVVCVRYEDLVTQPDVVQERLATSIVGLRVTARFADFHRTARPSEQSLRALHGIRPPAPDSVGAWRRHKPRLAAQLALHGPIDAELVALGYERDTRWLRELDGVSPVGAASYVPESLSLRRPLRWAAVIRIGIARYRVRSWLNRPIGPPAPGPADAETRRPSASSPPESARPPRALDARPIP